jgi:hypothetical protein
MIGVLVCVLICNLICVRWICSILSSLCPTSWCGLGLRAEGLGLGLRAECLGRLRV